MNERIKELVEQAQKHSREYVEDEVETQFHKKFAELIVRECANIDFRHKVGLSTDDDFEISRLIKQHFGVEE